MDKINSKLALLVNNNKAPIRLFLFLFPIIAIFVLIYLKVGCSDFYIKIVQDDAFLEDIQFIAYFCSAILAIAASFISLRKQSLAKSILLVILGLCLLFVSGEEISWAQRMFSIQSTQWFIEHNSQDEINLHNLEFIDDQLLLVFAVIGFVFSFGWIPGKYISQLKKNIKLKEILCLFIPVKSLMFFFIPTFILFSYWVQEHLKTHLEWYRWNSSFINDFLIRNNDDQESVEFLLAIGLLLYVLSLVWRLFRSPYKATEYQVK